MAINHAAPGQIVDVRALGQGLATAITAALFKSTDLEVIRLVLAAGKSLPPHRVPGEITVQCIEGLIDVEVDGKSHLIRAGQMLYLSGNALHSIKALDDASALVTIALKK
jgi:quercetin dioxygenase-like cupin family protein